jgi:hypothetical protein
MTCIFTVKDATPQELVDWAQRYLGPLPLWHDSETEDGARVLFYLKKLSEHSRSHIGIVVQGYKPGEWTRISITCPPTIPWRGDVGCAQQLSLDLGIEVCCGVYFEGEKRVIKIINGHDVSVVPTPPPEL